MTSRNQAFGALAVGQLLARRLPALDEVTQLDHSETKRSPHGSN
jgi:hypothetical protein